MKKNLYIILLCFLCLSLSEIQAENRWNINPDGSITWKLREKDAHQDHIEMSGLKISAVIRYGVDEKGAFTLDRSMIWPMLRTVPNNTHASLM